MKVRSVDRVMPGWSPYSVANIETIPVSTTS